MYVIVLLEEREVEDTNKKEHLTYDTCQNPPPSAKSVSNSNVQGEQSLCGIAQLNSGKEKKMCLI